MLAVTTIKLSVLSGVEPSNQERVDPVTLEMYKRAAILVQIALSFISQPNNQNHFVVAPCGSWLNQIQSVQMQMRVRTQFSTSLRLSS